MFPVSVARKYAEAFVQTLGPAADLVALAEELRQFIEIVASNRELGETLRNPILPLERKRTLVEGLVAAGGGNPFVAGAVVTALSNRHADGLPAIASAFG